MTRIAFETDLVDGDLLTSIKEIREIRVCIQDC